MDTLIVVENINLLRLFKRAMFNGLTNLSLLGNYCNPEETIAAIRDTLPDMVLLDLQNNDGKGMQVMRQIAKEFPEMEVKVVSNCTDPICLEVCNEIRTLTFFDANSHAGNS